MRLGDMFKMCLQNLFRRKSRTILTVLGVVVGCCAIVTMLSIGIGVQNSQEIMLAGMGDLTLIQVYSGGNSNSKLDEAAIKKFENIVGVDVAVGKMRLENIGCEVYAGERDRYTANWMEIVGISDKAMEKFGFELLDGTFPKSGGDEIQVLSGQYTAYNFMDSLRPEGSNYIDRWSSMWVYNPDTGETEYNENAELPDPYFDMLNQVLNVKLYSYDNYEKKYEQKLRVVGITKQDYNKDYTTSEGLIMRTSDMLALRRLVFPTSTDNKVTFNEVYVKALDISKVADVEAEIKKLGYNTYSMESIRKPLEEEARQQQMMLGGLGAVSLFVAALGITNTMIMSISERTREIGVMKALGCYLGNIRAIFLMEAGFIGLIGGLIGAGISYIISVVINIVSAQLQFEGMEFSQIFELIVSKMQPENSPVSIVPLWLAGFAVLFSIIIGLISGFYPANKAVHISAMEAIKRE